MAPATPRSAAPIQLPAVHTAAVSVGPPTSALCALDIESSYGLRIHAYGTTDGRIILQSLSADTTRASVLETIAIASFPEDSPGDGAWSGRVKQSDTTHLSWNGTDILAAVSGTRLGLFRVGGILRDWVTRDVWQVRCLRGEGCIAGEARLCASHCNRVMGSKLQ